MKFGQFTNPFKKNLPNQIKDILKWADYVELFIEPPYGTLADYRKNQTKIKNIIKKNNKFAIAHTAYYADVSSFYEKVRQAWIKELKETIDFCEDMNIRYLNIHTWTYGPGPIKIEKKTFLKNYIKSLRILVAYGKKHNVSIMCEGLAGEDTILAKFKDYNKVIKGVPGLKCHLDIGHINTFSGFKEIKKWIDTFKNKIAHIHVSDNSGLEDEHLQIGNGSINYKKVMQYLQKIKYNGTITPEIFEPKSGGPKKAVKMLKSYLK